MSQWIPSSLRFSPDFLRAQSKTVCQMENDFVVFPHALREFVDSSQWAHAKTMPVWPHEYIVRGRVDEQLFVQLVRHIRAHGYEGKFYQKDITYFDEAGMVYWTMGEPVEKTIIVNRCRKEDSYESRLAKGRLPAEGGG
jgi:hypothetical protein